MLEGADSIIVPLATLARSGETAPAPAAPLPSAPLPGDDLSGMPPLDRVRDPSPSEAPANAQTPAARPQEPAPAPPATATARPSFNCRYARTRGEIAVCGDAGLAALDRQMASQYYRALSAADGRQRSTLVSTRNAFLRYRDGCPNNQCMAETYLGRMREIRDIMRR
jgi:uncharacterized protein YecT (DUF1311 family)